MYSDRFRYIKYLCSGPKRSGYITFCPGTSKHHGTNWYGVGGCPREVT